MQRQLYAKRAALHLHHIGRLLPKNAHVAFYWDNFGELPTFSLLSFCKRYHYRAYLPVVSSNYLMFCPIFPKNASLYWTHRLPQKKHALGMNEPIKKTLLPANRMHAIFCPLVAVDKKGTRLGMGGGFYDRTLATYTGLKIGWCYDFQYTDMLAKQVWDIAMGWIITPTRCIKVSSHSISQA